MRLSVDTELAHLLPIVGAAVAAKTLADISDKCICTPEKVFYKVLTGISAFIMFGLVIRA